MTLVLFSAAFRAMLIVLLYRLVTRFRHILTFKERVGAGGMGGSGFMTIAVILDVHKQGTPYDTWAGLLFSASAVVFFWGFILRKIGHERRNEQAVDQARAHLTGRGKL